MTILGFKHEIQIQHSITQYVFAMQRMNISVIPIYCCYYK